MVYNWGHLHTIMARNTVEFALVALAVSEQRFLSPMANFYSAMFTHNVVSLLLQLRLQERVHRISDKYCRFNPTLDVQVVRSPFHGGIWWYSQAMVLAFVIQASLAIILLEYVNYLQHYGLRREVGERHTMMHSWEHRGVWSRWTLLELPLHPSHHLKASIPMWDLRAYDG